MTPEEQAGCADVMQLLAARTCEEDLLLLLIRFLFEVVVC